MFGGLSAALRELRRQADVFIFPIRCGAREPINALLSESAHRCAQLRVFAETTGLTRMVKFVTEPDTRRLATNATAGLGMMAVIAVGAPVLEHRVEEQAEARTWRLRAQAFVEADADQFAEARPSVKRMAALQTVDQPARDRAVVAPYQTFAPVHFETAVEQRVDLDCLSRAIYYEARSESQVGQLAVAEVVLNRVSHRLYPNNVCDVVYEGTDRETGLSWRGNHLSCQFSFTCDGSEARRPPRGARWQQAQNIAAHAMMGLSTAVTGDATHYHANYVRPYWAPRLVHTKTIGTHIFYRFPQSDEESGRRGA